MPGNVEHFSSLVSTIPPRVYLDTSFLLRCYFARFTPRGLNPAEQTKNTQCNSFLGRLAGSKICTSLLTIEEGLHRLYFTAHIRPAARKYSLDQRWKEYRRLHQVDFLAARSSGIQETSRFLSFYDKSGIILIGATSFFHRERYLSLVKWYASLLLQKYEVIEAMDAFHIAIMRVNRIDWFVTAEEDLGSGFDEFSVLTL